MPWVWMTRKTQMFNWPFARLESISLFLPCFHVLSHNLCFPSYLLLHSQHTFASVSPGLNVLTTTLQPGGPNGGVVVWQQRNSKTSLILDLWWFDFDSSSRRPNGNKNWCNLRLINRLSTLSRLESTYSRPMQQLDKRLHTRRPALVNARQNRSHYVNTWMAPLCHPQKWPELQHRNFHWTCHMSLQVLMLIKQGYEFLYSKKNKKVEEWKNETECNDVTLRSQKTHGLQAHLHNVRSIIQMLKASDYAQAWKWSLWRSLYCLAELWCFLVKSWRTLLHGSGLMSWASCFGDFARSAWHPK